MSISNGRPSFAPIVALLIVLLLSMYVYLSIRSYRAPRQAQVVTNTAEITRLQGALKQEQDERRKDANELRDRIAELEQRPLPLAMVTAGEPIWHSNRDRVLRARVTRLEEWRYRVESAGKR